MSVVNTSKMADLKDEILSETYDKFSEFKLDILAELKQQLKIEVAEAFKNELKRGKSQSQQSQCFNNMFRFVRIK